MRNIIGILSVLITICLVVMPACNPPWEDHYSNLESQNDMELWEAISVDPNFSTYVSKMEALDLDTIFQDGLVYTLFIPNNEAFESYVDTGNILQTLQYHISRTIIMNRNIEKSRRVLTLSGKYALIEATGSDHTYDEIPVMVGSPLFLNGKYYEITNVALPKPNLYEFTANNSSVLKEYIESKDSIYLDRSLSTPTGFDDEGNTEYDSVFTLINTFEQEYFPISKEFRNEAATFILFSDEQYISALDDMASRLGGEIVDHGDIPASWQNNILLPDFAERAMFPGDLSYADLEIGKLQSITGDSVEILAERIDPDSRTICSNGVAYLYNNFVIEDELFRGTVEKEGEMLLDSVGAGRFAWKEEEVTTTGSIFAPEKNHISEASGGSVANVSFERDYDGEYSMEFAFKEMFPMRYRLEWHCNYRPSGIYEVYVNDQRLEFKDKYDNIKTEFDTYELRESIISVTGDRFFPNAGFNTRDYWIDHLTNYGDIRIRFKYVGSGESSTNGFNIDYVKLIPDF